MISIVIPAYNEEKNIEKCLTALVNQQTDKKCEVIVVDNNSTDKTAQKAKTFAKSLSITVIFEKQKGRGAARKSGFNNSSGDIILSTDADTVVPPDWAEKLYTGLIESRGVAISGTCKITDCDGLTNAVFNTIQPLAMRMYRYVFGHYWLSGFSFAIYKKAYEDSGGFNPKLNALEDVDLSFRVKQIGRIIFLKNTPVIFSGRRFKSGLVGGIVPYVTSFVKYFFLKKENVEMSDPRQ